jgi:hypothetical protein
MCQFKLIFESPGKEWWLYNHMAELKRKFVKAINSLRPINSAEKRVEIFPSLPDTDATVINLGDYVKVRSKQELLALMEEKTYKCRIMPEMYESCGKRYKVLKKVENFYDEVKQKMCKCKDIFLLEGSTCSGKLGSFPQPCDLKCFYFWHKDWLEKI